MSGFGLTLFSKLSLKRTMFWPYQIAGWTILVLIVCLRVFFQMISTYGDSADLADEYLSYIIFGLAGMMLTCLLRYIYRYIYIKQYPFITTIGIIILMTLLFSIVHLFLVLKLRWIIIGTPSPSGFFHYIVTLIWNLPIFFGWSILYFGIKYWNQSVFERNRAEKADMLAQSAQLQMLRYQLNPHFLFNSLNSIWALIDEDKKASKEMVGELAEFLRYSLMSKNYSDVPLRQEIEAIRHYFSIEQKRFEEQLEVEFDIDPEAEDFPVLSFILNPLVENAVKYGMRTSPMPLRIRIMAKVSQHTLTLKVFNTGKWIAPVAKESAGSTGTGLQNIRLRLENAFPGKSGFEIGQVDDKVIATITIHGRS